MDIFAIVTAVIGIVSLIALIYQSINMRTTIENQIYQSFINNSVELDKILIERPEIRKYVYDNEIVDDNTEDLDRVMSTIELIVDITENIDVYKKFIPASRRDGWLAFVKDMENTSAYLYYMEKYAHWYKIK